MDCPIHNVVMVKTFTRFGIRHSCPKKKCTYVSWNGNQPADERTRLHRQLAHVSFDVLWLSKIFTRTEAYLRLGQAMGKSPNETHIGKFSFEECEQVIRFVEEMTNSGFSGDYYNER